MVQDIYTLLFDIKAQGGPQVASQSTTAAKGVNTLATSTNTANTNATKTTKTVGDMGKKTGELGKQSKTAGASIKSFGAGISTAALGISSMAVGVIGLTRGYRDLNDAQLGVDRAQKKLDSANLQLAKSHDAVKKALKEHGKNSKEYKQALEKEKIATQGVAIAQFNLGEKQEDLNDAQQNFYLNLLPVGIGVMTTASGLFEGMGKNAGGAATGVKTLGTGMKAINTVLKLSPLFLLAGALIAIKYNIGGFRDMLDKVGKRLGEMFPGLQGFLQWVRDLGAAFGLTGEKMDLHKAFDLLKKGFEGFLNTIQTTDWGKVIDDMANQISTAINTFDWATAWQSFQNALVSTGEWIGPRLAQIGDRIQKYFGDPKVQAAIWQGFHDGMVAAGTWIYEQLGKIFDAIYKYFSDPKVQKAIWEGFQYAMYATGDWVFSALVQIGSAIINYFGDPKVQKALWDGFQSAMYGIGDWVLTNLASIYSAVVKYFSDKKNTDAMWKGFRDAMYAAGVWVGEMLIKIMQYVASWWKGHSSAMSKGFAGFINYVYQVAVSLGKSLPQKIIDGLVSAASTLLRAGKFIWDKIADGLGFAGKSLAQIGQAIANKLAGKAQGGVMLSAATGRVMTTHGPTLVMAGDNGTRGQEDVAFIPRNDPGRTLKEIDQIYGRRASLVVGGGGKAIINLNMPIVIGGKVLDYLIKTIEVELGKNMRSIIP